MSIKTNCVCQEIPTLKSAECGFEVNIESPNIRVNCRGDVPNQVNFLKITGNVTYFPILPPYFTEIYNISIKNAGLKAISQKDFQALNKLESIDLSGNKIDSIHPEAFNGLNNLKTLDLTGNVCISASVKDSSVDAQKLIKIAGEKCSTDPKSNRKKLIYIIVGLACVIIAMIVAILVKNCQIHRAIAPGISNRGYESHTLPQTPRVERHDSGDHQAVRDENNRKEI